MIVYGADINSFRHQIHSCQLDLRECKAISIIRVDIVSLIRCGVVERIFLFNNRIISASKSIVHRDIEEISSIHDWSSVAEHVQVDFG